jgi:hypothetical protein
MSPLGDSRIEMRRKVFSSLQSKKKIFIFNNYEKLKNNRALKKLV